MGKDRDSVWLCQARHPMPAVPGYSSRSFCTSMTEAEMKGVHILCVGWPGATATVFEAWLNVNSSARSLQ